MIRGLLFVFVVCWVVRPGGDAGSCVREAMLGRASGGRCWGVRLEALLGRAPGGAAGAVRPGRAIPIR